MPRYWLVKTEPSTYSFADLQREKKTTWDGVKNALALKHVAQVRKGDTIVVYHTGDEKAAVGLATAESDPYPDPKKRDPKLLVFDLAFRKAFARPVSLAAVKANPKLADFPLVRLPRLSVMPVTPEQFAEICRMSR